MSFLLILFLGFVTVIPKDCYLGQLHSHITACLETKPSQRACINEGNFQLNVSKTYMYKLIANGLS